MDFYFLKFLFEIVSLFFFSLSWQRYDSMTYGNLNVKYSAGLLSRFIISTFNFTIRRFVRTIISVYRSSKTLRTRWDDIIDNRSVTDFISDLQFKKTKRDEFQCSFVRINGNAQHLTECEASRNHVDIKTHKQSRNIFLQLVKRGKWRVNASKERFTRVKAIGIAERPGMIIFKDRIMVWTRQEYLSVISARRGRNEKYYNVGRTGVIFSTRYMDYPQDIESIGYLEKTLIFTPE